MTSRRSVKLGPALLSTERIHGQYPTLSRKETIVGRYEGNLTVYEGRVYILQANKFALYHFYFKIFFLMTALQALVNDNVTTPKQ